MKVSIASDHGGFELKEEIVKFLTKKGYEVFDRGSYGLDSVDYPLYAKYVCMDLKNHISEKGILICTTGIGMSIMANKFKGIRAALVSNCDAAKLTRNHNDSNVICLGAKYTSVSDAKKIIEIFLEESFLGGRHSRRVDMINEEEKNEC